MKLAIRIPKEAQRVILSVVGHLLLVGATLSVAFGVESLARFGFVGDKGADVYYDGYHGSRHLWNRANKRHRFSYHTVSGFNRFYNALHEEGFDVHVETYRRFNRRILDKYDVFFVGEQTYHARFMDDRERDDLVAWVKDGGSLFALIEHTDAHYMAEVFDRLFAEMPIEVRRDGICDMNQPGPISPSWVDLTSEEDHPVNEGVREYRFYNGASLDTPHGVLFSMKSSWSDDHNPQSRPIQNGNKTRDPEELSGPLAGAAAFEYGKGKVVVIGDHNAMSNPTMYWGDHYRFVMNSMKWLASDRLNADLFWVIGGLLVWALLAFARSRWGASVPATWKTALAGLVAGAAVYGLVWLSKPPVYDFFVYAGNDTAMKYNTKKSGGYMSMYGQWTKEPQLRPWASRLELREGYDALFLSAPRERFSEEQMRKIEGYLERGKTVVYMATVSSLESEAGEQLMDKFRFDVKIDREFELKGTRPLNIWGQRDLTESIFRMYVYRGQPGVTVDGMRTLVHVTRGGYHVREKQWNSTRHVFDLISEKEMFGGRFILFTPVEVFSDRGLKNLFTDADVVRQQMAELAIRLAKHALDDDTVYYVD